MKNINQSYIKIMVNMWYCTSFIMAMSSNSWLFFWACLEFNMMFFIPLLKKMNNNHTTAMMKYFIIQSMSSSVFLMFIITINLTNTSNLIYNFMINMALWMKLGLFPFNMWFYQMTENLEWNMYFLVSTLQKMLPLYLISLNLVNLKIMILLIWTNSIYSIMEAFNQTSMRWMINSSSLNHFSWMILSMNSKYSIWMTYFYIYLMISYYLYLFLKKMNFNSTQSFYNNLNQNSIIIFTLIMMNFMGIPPFLGFLPKMLILLTNFNLYNCMLLIMNSLMLAKIYFFFCTPLIMKNVKNKMNKNLYKMNNSFIVLFFTFFMIMPYF